MKNLEKANQILEEMKSENLVSYAERVLRAKINFAKERLTIINSMIFKNEDLKVSGVSPEYMTGARKQFSENVERRSSWIAKQSKGKDISKVASKHSQSVIRGREGYNIIQP